MSKKITTPEAQQALSDAGYKGVLFYEGTYLTLKLRIGPSEPTLPEKLCDFFSPKANDNAEDVVA